MDELAPVTFLLGATATGKSAWAMRLAKRYGAAILSVDSMQVYRGADIGTSKPTFDERACIPHGGLDLAEVGEAFDTARYVRHAAEFIQDQHAHGRKVIAVGGTGLYFRALTQGLCEAPPADPGLRAELAALTIGELRARLAAVDPVILARLDPNNPRRLTRALEVKLGTGLSLLEWQQQRPAPPAVTAYLAFQIIRPRDELRRRITSRVDAMLAAGWSGEVQRLANDRGKGALRRFPAIGYRLLLQDDPAAVCGDLASIQQQIADATWAYARRQLTWFRRESNLTVVNTWQS
jgi:tRNA dimethylallyltransferase